MGKEWDETVVMSHQILQERARRTAEAIASVGQRHLSIVPTEKLSERQAEDRHRSVQAQKLKR